MAEYWLYRPHVWTPWDPWTEEDGELWLAIKMSGIHLPSALDMQVKIARRFSQFLAPTPSGCTAWIGPRKETGYGLFLGFSAHRISHELFVGPIWWAHQVLHKCDNKWCVNPEHLYSGTNDENTRDMQARGRAAGQKYIVVPANENALQRNRSARLGKIKKMRRKRPSPKH